MRTKMVCVVLVLIVAALACTAPGAADTQTPEVVTVVVTADESATSAPTEETTSEAAGLSCGVQQDVRVHNCVGTSSSSVIGVSPAGSTFTPTKWDGSNWFYGNIPIVGGSQVFGWVSRLNSDGSTLVACSGDTSTLPKAYDPCPTAIPPTATWTPIPPTDTPQPTATATTKPAGTCGDGVADPGEECGEPGLTCGGPLLHICKACKCTLPVITTDFCGDGKCTGSENFSNCAKDCPLIIKP